MNFPLVTWSATVGPVTVDSNPAFAAQTRYGFSIDSTTLKTAAYDSVPDYLRDALNAAHPGMVTKVEYVYTDGPGPSNSPLQVKYTYTAGANRVVDFGSVAMANIFGFETQIGRAHV